jgi:hypothetical protein
MDCPTPSFCVAVGWATSWPVIQMWNGRQWSTLNQLDLSGQLFDIDCSSPSSCVAVGSVNPPDASWPATLHEHWDGRSWTVLAGIVEIGAIPQLHAVSCVSPNFCVAVGNFGHLNTNQGTLQGYLIEMWDGRSWSIAARTAYAIPQPYSWYDLTTVTCASKRSCRAEGPWQTYVGGTVGSLYGTVVASWNGRTWTVSEVPE